MFRKIITYFLILAVVLPVLASAVPLGDGRQALSVKTSFAQETNASDDKLEKVKSKLAKESSSDGKVIDMCDFIWGEGTLVGCAMWLFVDWFLYKVVLKLSVLLSSIAGAMFNASIDFSLTGKTFDASENGNTMIRDGWTMVRDLLNLVFIFILLFAAISTILQYGNMDIKKILPSLIVVALLVNFSLMIAKMVIDASHIFAWEFYNQIDVKNKEKLGDGKEVAHIKNDINVYYGAFEKKNLANVFLAGFNPQTLLTGNTTKPSAFAGAMEEARKNGDGGKIFSLMTQMMIILVLQSALTLFAGFILFAGAIMFVIRIVVLWLVMIFSPIAFLGMILPSMEQYSKMWWGYLVSQSFFAPAFLFMFMLVTKFINSKFIDSIVQATENSSFKIAFGLDAAILIMPIFHYMVVGGLMMACLIVARQLGGKTAEFGISWAHKGKNLALGGAKKLAWSPTRLGLRYGGGLAGDSGWWARSIGRIPGGGMLGRKLGAMKKADEDKLKKAAEKYAGTLSKAGRESLEREIGGTKGVGGFVKRFAYTGPEGAFKPGKESYEKIIGRKKAEKYEEENYHKNMAILAGIDDVKNASGGIINKKEDIIKSMINKGERDNLDKRIEANTKKIEDSFTKGASILEKVLMKVEVDLREKGAELYEAKRNNLSQADVDIIKLRIVDKERQKSGLKGQEIIMDKKKKEREAIEKLVEKYEAKQDTEKLGAKFSSSGAGGGGGSKGGGGKTTP